MLTVEDIKDTYKQTRSMHLDSLLGDLYTRDMESIPQDNQMIDYAWDVDGNLNGIQNLIAYYYSELYALTGVATNKPAVYSESVWQDQFDLALTIGGDGADGFYPNGAESEIFNIHSPWLEWNGYTVSGTAGLIGKSLSSVESPVRVIDVPPAVDSGLYAIDYIRITTPLSTQYYKSSTYYNALLSAFNAYKAALDAYKLKWDALTASASNVFITLGTSLINIDSTLNTYITQAQTYMSAVTTQYNAAPASAAALSSYAAYEAALDTLRAYLITRRDEVEDFFTDNIVSEPAQSLRNLRIFTVAGRIDKSIGSYVKYLGILTSITGSKNAVISSSNLLSKIETDPLKWVSKPAITSAYYKEVLNLQKETLRTENYLYINGPDHVSKIKIYKKKITRGTLLTNAAWSEDFFYTFTNLRSITTNAISSVWAEVIPSNARGCFYLYRVSCEDEGEAYPADIQSILDDFYPLGMTASPQSDVIGTEVSFQKKEDATLPIGGGEFALSTILSGTVESLGIDKGDYVYIKNRGIFLIVKTAESEIGVYPPLGIPVAGPSSRVLLSPIYGFINSYVLT